MAPVIEIDGCSVYAVPAVHYRAPFAAEVNRICSDPRTRPEAIAVELAPHIAYELRTWMSELVAGHSELPCMLGLMVKNQLIHPDYFESAVNLQMNTGKQLAEISPQLIKNLLHFSENLLIGLSSTDSIIEAVRCSVGLNIPVYGVDMDEYSVNPGRSPLIEEPVSNSFDLEKYASRFEGMAATFRDAYVDSRRETIMAARLKYIARRFKRILFTGGLAHWVMLKKLLNDPSLKPAEFLDRGPSGEMTRVIIHPKIAVAFMDRYPLMSTLYERSRNSPGEGTLFPAAMETPYNIYRGILDKVYSRYLPESGKNKFSPRNESWKLADFERLMANIAMVHPGSSPSMTEMLACSESMMPQEFTRLLADQLMDIGRPWASIGQFPELPVVYLVPEGSGDRTTPPELYKLVSKSNENNDQGSRYKRSRSFNVNYREAYPLPGNPLDSWEWSNEPKEHGNKAGSFCWVWPPCEALLYGTAYEASALASTTVKKNDSLPFEGSLHEGLDIKATMRSSITGEKKIYVKKTSLSRRTSQPDLTRPEPVVFIFDEFSSEVKPEWSLMLAALNFGNLIKNKKNLYNETVRKFGNYFVTVVCRTVYIEPPEAIRDAVDSYGILEGILKIGHPCINAKQGAEWLEQNDFNACPVLQNTSIHTLVDFYKRHHGISIDESDWKSTLILAGIPYARERVVIIAPAGFKPSLSTFSAAKRRNISLDFLPLNYFSAERIAGMRRRLTVRTSDSYGLHYPPEAERILGEKPDKYFDLFPPLLQQEFAKYSHEGRNENR
jgi:hypothetical protein